MTPAQRQTLAANLARVRGRIAAAAGRAGREAAAITLVAVTKSVGPEVIAALIDLGARDIGENRFQDALARFAKVPNLARARRHFIGHLQRNKVKGVLDHFDCVHSLDSLELAREIDKRAKRPVECFIEVNSGEAQKGGIEAGELPALLEALRPLKNIRALGLMTMAPLGREPEASRPHFQRLATLARAHRLEGLSMGMSGDFEVAIECGASHVRVGGALFEGLHAT